MNTTTIIISLGGLAVATAVCEKIANSIGQTEIATYIKVGGISGSGIVAIGLAYKLLSTLKGI